MEEVRGVFFYICDVCFCGDALNYSFSDGWRMCTGTWIELIFGKRTNDGSGREMDGREGR